MVVDDLILATDVIKVAVEPIIDGAEAIKAAADVIKVAVEPIITGAEVLVVNVEVKVFAP